MPATADVLVIGAGVIGAAAALELAKRGRRVTVVDKLGGPGQGSTSASSAVVRFNFSTLAGVATAWEAKHCWENWADHLGLSRAGSRTSLASFVRIGMVTLDAPPATQEDFTALFDQVGVPYESWDTATLQQRVPAIDTGKYWPPKRIDDDAFFAEATDQLGGLYTPDAGFVDDPHLAADNLARAAREHGVEFVFNRHVVDVCRAGGRVSGVDLSDGSTISTPVVLNAAGPWSGAVNRLAGVGDDFTISVRPMRQEVHQVRAPRAYNSVSDTGPAIADMDLGIYIRPSGSEFLLIGGTEPECDPLEWLDDADLAQPGPTVGRFEAQVTRAARRLPGLTIPNRPTGVAGVYDVADDWKPIYDRTNLDGFYVAMGTSGNQFKNAPLVGKFLAALIEGVEAGADHDATPLTYVGEHTGRAIDLGAFSRRRAPDATGASTVMG